MIGVLAIQGGFAEHEQMLMDLGLAYKEVRSLKDVEGLTGFIIPGGESTVMDQFMQNYGLKDWLLERALDPEFVIFGTCAGLILLARYGLLNVEVQRNAYGRQLASFKTKLHLKELGVVKGHFIRAPKIVKLGDDVEVLTEHGNIPVLVRQGGIWGASFHPELAGDSTLHAAIFLC